MLAMAPCSSFALKGKDEVLLAKNFDWNFDGGYLVKNPIGVKRSSLPLFGGEPTSWTSIYGSLTFTQYGAGLPYGGINQRGLAIEMLWLDETVYPATAARTISELEWIQYQLDTRANVAEVVSHLDELSIRPIAGKIHYMLADDSGDRALVEFIDGVPKVQRGGLGALVCTNDTHRLSELVFDKLRTLKLNGNTSWVRYARLRLGVEAPDATPSVESSFAELEKVAEKGSTYRTQWSAVYEVRKGRVHIKPGNDSRVFAFDVNALDYSTKSGTAYQDLFGKDLSVAKFEPLTAAAQQSLLSRNLPKVGLNNQLDAIAGHLLDPSASTVRPLDDRATLLVRVRVKAPGAFARIAVFQNQGEITDQKSKYAGSALLDTEQRDFAFYNLPAGKYAVGAFHDHNQNGRPDPGEPLAFFHPDSKVTGSNFDDLAFELKDSPKTVEIVLE